MILDLNLYLINKPFIQEWYASHKDTNKDITTVVSMWASALSCPCLVLAFYLAETEGFTPALVKNMDSLIKFYDYRVILGQSSNSPYLTLS